MAVTRSSKSDAEKLKALYSDPWYRLNNLYYIKDKRGKRVLFQMNEAQTWLWERLWYCNFVLKARQLGFSTFIDILGLDRCLWNDQQTFGLIDRTLEDAKKKMTEKIEYPFDHLPEFIQEANPMSGSKLEKTWGNGSNAWAGTSLRGGTVQVLHVSELGPIAFDQPAKAEEIRAGAFATVDKGQMIFVESTHKGGKGGVNYEIGRQAQENDDDNLTVMDFRFHFFPWWMDPNYGLEGDFPYLEEEEKYFRGLADNGVKLTREQKNWYVKQWRRIGDARFQEYPSTAEEAWYVRVEGAVYGKEISAVRARGGIGRIPYEPMSRVHTFWDLGISGASKTGAMGIWFIQFVFKEIRVLRYYQNENLNLAHYKQVLDKFQEQFGWVYGGHYAPHDVKKRSIELGVSLQDFARDLGINFTRVPITPVLVAIEATRTLFPRCWFDAEGCKHGLNCLESYHFPKDETNNVFKPDPVHDWSSDAAKSFETMTLAMKYGIIDDSSDAVMEENQPTRMHRQQALAGSRRRESPGLTRAPRAIRG
jgi:hypothetical protein